MKKFVIFIFIFMPVLSVFSQQTDSKAVNVKAELNKQEIVVGEPLFLQLELTNVSEQQKNFMTRLAYTGDLRIEVNLPNKLPIEYLGIHEHGFPPYFTFKIPPGKTDRVDSVILYHSDSPKGLLFSYPLKATIRVTLDGIIDRDPVTYRFKPWQITVKNPDQKNARVLNLIREKKIIEQIHRGVANDETRPRLLEIWKQYPDSVYSPYILFAVASGLAAGQEEKSLNEAINYYEKYLEKYPGALYEDDAVYKIGYCYDKLEETGKAQKWFVRLYNSYPKSSRLNNQDPVIRKYITSQIKAANPPGKWMLFEGQPEPDPNDQNLMSP